MRRKAVVFNLYVESKDTSFQSFNYSLTMIVNLYNGGGD